MKFNVLLFVTSLLLTVPNLLAQTSNGYTGLINYALDAADQAESIGQQQEVLKLFDSAFSQYPDSIETVGLYAASTAAATLGEKDKAFNYLNQLLLEGKDSYGLEGWFHIIYGESEEDFNNLKDDTRWSTLIAQAYSKQKAFMAQLSRHEEEFYLTNSYLEQEKSKASNEELYQLLRNDSRFLDKQEREYSLSLTVNDSIQTSFFVLLPKDYDSRKQYPLLFFLHGAVKQNQFVDFLTKEEVQFQCGKFIPKIAERNEVILVFPKANKQYNWMNPDDGFFMVPTILNKIKNSINVDDNRVFILGHSNGATGSFSYLMKQPSSFAGFYGFNTYPKVFTGGTFILNILNRSYMSITTNLDYYYPPKANDSLSRLMHEIGADYKECRYVGFPHWFPQLDESESAVELLFDDIGVRTRNPFHSRITWEFDDNRYGTIDWVTEAKLDTISPKATWHSRSENFDIKEWLKYDERDSLVVVPVEKKGFDFPRSSGKIVAEYADNIFRVKTSCISFFCINISPEMVDMSKPVVIYWNNKLYYSGIIPIDRDFMLRDIQERRDRKCLWVNRICVQ